MYKKLKLKYKNRILKKKLLKEKVFFNRSSLSFSDKNVLIIDEIIPEFNKDSGSRRLTGIIKILLQNKVSVFLVADLKQYKYKSDYIESFKELGVNVYEPAIDNNGVLVTKELFVKKIASKMQFAWLHRPSIFQKYYPIVKNANANCKCIFDMVDFHYLRLSREYKLNKNESLKKEANAHLIIELDNCKKADIIIAITEDDKQELLKYYEDASKIEIISNFHQFITKPIDFLPFKDREQLLFIGSFKHVPNVDAVKYLKDQIMPIVWKQIPDIKVLIVGSYPTQEIVDLNSDNFIVKGFVADVESYFKQVKLFIAPLRYGAGIKGKIGQSLEYSLPLVTTDIGAEGFEFSPFEAEMIGNTSEEFASRIIELYTNEALWNSISNHAEEVLKPFSLQTINTSLIKVLNL